MPSTGNTFKSERETIGYNIIFELDNQFEEIRDLIAYCKVDLALDKCKSILEYGKEFQNQIAIISSRYYLNENNYRAGIINYDEYYKNITSISFAILKTFEEFDKISPATKRENNSPIQEFIQGINNKLSSIEEKIIYIISVLEKIK